MHGGGLAWTCSQLVRDRGFSSVIEVRLTDTAHFPLCSGWIRCWDSVVFPRLFLCVDS